MHAGISPATRNHLCLILNWLVERDVIVYVNCGWGIDIVYHIHVVDYLRTFCDLKIRFIHIWAILSNAMRDAVTLQFICRSRRNTSYILRAITLGLKVVVLIIFWRTWMINFLQWTAITSNVPPVTMLWAILLPHTQFNINILHITANINSFIWYKVA